MSITFALKLIMASATLIFGIISLVFPKKVAEMIGLNVDKPMGLAEIRTGWGGLYIGLGLGALVLRYYPVVFIILAFAYAGMAITRLIQGLLKPSLMKPVYLGALAFEIICALIFVSETGFFL